MGNFSQLNLPESGFVFWRGRWWKESTKFLINCGRKRFLDRVVLLKSCGLFKCREADFDLSAKEVEKSKTVELSRKSINSGNLLKDWICEEPVLWYKLSESDSDREGWWLTSSKLADMHNSISNIIDVVSYSVESRSSSEHDLQVQSYPMKWINHFESCLMYRVVNCYRILFKISLTVKGSSGQYRVKK